MRLLRELETNTDSYPDRRRRSRREADRFPVPRVHDRWIALKTGVANLLVIKEARNFWARLRAAIGEK